MGRLVGKTVDGAEQAAEPIVDEGEGLHHLADTLSGDVLKRAGLEDVHAGRVDFRLGLGIREVDAHDRLGRLQDRVGGLLGGPDNLVELLASARDAVRRDLVGSRTPDFEARLLDVVGEALDLPIHCGVDRCEVALHALDEDLGDRGDIRECGRIAVLGAQEINEVGEIAGEFLDLHRTITHCGRRQLSILRDAEDHVNVGTAGRLPGHEVLGI